MAALHCEPEKKLDHFSVEHNFAVMTQSTSVTDRWRDRQTDRHCRFAVVYTAISCTVGVVKQCAEI